MDAEGSGRARMHLPTAGLPSDGPAPATIESPWLGGVGGRFVNVSPMCRTRRPRPPGRAAAYQRTRPAQHQAVRGAVGPALRSLAHLEGRTEQEARTQPVAARAALGEFEAAVRGQRPGERRHAPAGEHLSNRWGPLHTGAGRGPCRAVKAEAESGAGGGPGADAFWRYGPGRSIPWLSCRAGGYRAGNAGWAPHPARQTGRNRRAVRMATIAPP